MNCKSIISDIEKIKFCMGFVHHYSTSKDRSSSQFAKLK